MLPRKKQHFLFYEYPHSFQQPNRIRSEVRNNLLSSVDRRLWTGYSYNNLFFIASL